MKPPGWLKLEFKGGKYRIGVRRWHPGLWVEVFRTLRAQGSGILASAWYTLVFLRHI